MQESHTLKRFGQTIERLIHWNTRIFKFIAMGLLFLMMLVVTRDVIGRYLFKSPLAGSTDILQLFMVLVVFFGLAYCAQMDGHTRVDVLHRMFPRRVQAIVDSVTFGLSVFIFAFITWRLGARAWNILLNMPGPRTDYLQFPHVYFICLAALGSLALCLELLVDLFHIVHRIRQAE